MSWGNLFLSTIGSSNCGNLTFVATCCTCLVFRGSGFSHSTGLKTNGMEMSTKAICSYSVCPNFTLPLLDLRAGDGKRVFMQHAAVEYNPNFTLWGVGLCQWYKHVIGNCLLLIPSKLYCDKRILYSLMICLGPQVHATSINWIVIFISTIDKI